MSKREKPIKLAPGKYSYKGYILKSYGSYGVDKNVEWKAVNDDTGDIEFTASSLHELTNKINNK